MQRTTQTCRKDYSNAMGDGDPKEPRMDTSKNQLRIGSRSLKVLVSSLWGEHQLHVYYDVVLSSLFVRLVLFVCMVRTAVFTPIVVV